MSSYGNTEVVRSDPKGKGRRNQGVISGPSLSERQEEGYSRRKKRKGRAHNTAWHVWDSA